jgi:hypothetical protein
MSSLIRPPECVLSRHTPSPLRPAGPQLARHPARPTGPPLGRGGKGR